MLRPPAAGRAPPTQPPKARHVTVFARPCQRAGSPRRRGVRARERVDVAELPEGIVPRALPPRLDRSVPAADGGRSGACQAVHGQAARIPRPSRFRQDRPRREHPRECGAGIARYGRVRDQDPGGVRRAGPLADELYPRDRHGDIQGRFAHRAALGGAVDRTARSRSSSSAPTSRRRSICRASRRARSRRSRSPKWTPGAIRRTCAPPRRRARMGNRS